MVLGRLFAYGDSARYRDGANYDQLPINKPINEVHTTTRTARCATAQWKPASLRADSYGGPRADPQRYRIRAGLWKPTEIMPRLHGAKDDKRFIQPGALYRQDDVAHRSGPSGRQHRLALEPGVERFNPGTRR